MWLLYLSQIRTLHQEDHSYILKGICPTAWFWHIDLEKEYVIMEISLFMASSGGFDKAQTGLKFPVKQKMLSGS